MKIAIIGSGAAAMGVMTALRARADIDDIDVYDPDVERPGGVTPPEATDATSNQFRRDLYRTIRANQGLSFPPPKSNFGTAPDRHEVDGRKRLWKSDFLGGLTNYWGASVLPFTDHELRDWPIKAADLQPHYARIAEEIGIAGSKDGLNAYFAQDFVNRPAIPLPAPLERLRGTIDQDAAMASIGDARLHAGVSRLAVETRDGHANQCIYCGDCMTGCARGAIYAATRAFTGENGNDFKRITATVLAIDPKRRTLVVTDNGDGAKERVSPVYDRIYLAAGCIASTRILMRSFDVAGTRTCADNAVFTLPMLHLGRRQSGTAPRSPESPPIAEDGQMFALTNLLISCVSNLATEPTIQMQVYSTSDYYWRFYIPAPMWRLLAPLGNFMKRRLFWVRVYLPSDQSQAYAISASPEPCNSIGLARSGPASSEINAFINRLRQPARRAGFVIPPVRPISHGTSSHYGCTFAYGAPPLHIPASGEVSTGVYVCDSTVFPSLPAVSPTFTIMANAHRTAVASLSD